MEWKDKYLTGVKEIDEQHKKLFEISEDLTYATDINDLRNLLVFFEEYINFHFESEEKLMKSHNYPYYEEHKSIHKCLIDKIRGYTELYLMGNFSLLEDLEQLIIEWIEDHILIEDKKYGDYIFNKN